MNTLHQLFTCGVFFGPTWNKLFRRNIIEKYNLRFDENISFREDELFTFEYCMYIKSVRILSTASYNYRQTPNSLMRRYIPPECIEYVADKSYEAAIQLPLTDEFRNEIERYYTDTLSMIGWAIYTQKHLKPRSYRLHILEKISQRKSYANVTDSCRRVLPFNVLLSDYYHLLRYTIKALWHLLCKPTKNWSYETKNINSNAL